MGSSLRFAVALMIGCVVVAGCTGDGRSAEHTSAPLTADSGVDEETGSLYGRVTDDELFPIAGAVVYSVLGREQLSATDELGGFVLNGLPPGRLELQFQAVGYEGVVRSFPILAGEALEVSVILKRIPTKVGYSQTWEHVGYMNLSVGTPATSPRLGAYQWTRPVESDLRTTVSSMKWTPTVTGTASKFRLVLRVWDEPWRDTVGPTPIVVRVDDPNATDPSRAQIVHDVLIPTTCNGLSPTSCISAAPFLLDPVVSQRFTIYVSAFYWDPAPAGFSNLPPA